MCAALSKQFCEKQCAITFKSQNDLLPSHLSTCLLISIFTKQYPTLRLQREVAAFQRAAVFIQQIIFQSMWIKCIQKLHMTLNGGIFKSLFIKNKNKKKKKYLRIKVQGCKKRVQEHILFQFKTFKGEGYVKIIMYE